MTTEEIKEGAVIKSTLARDYYVIICMNVRGLLPNQVVVKSEYTDRPAYSVKSIQWLIDYCEVYKGGDF